MRKTLRRFLALLVAAIMVVGISSFSFAADSGTITITAPDGVEANSTNTYKVYRVFDAVGNGTNISYKLVEGKDTAPAGFKISTAGNVSLERKEGDLETLTKEEISAIKAYVENDDPVAEVTITGAGSKTTPSLPNGYYYITTTTGSLVSVDSTNPTAEVKDKNKVPTIKKEVQEDRDNSWGKKDDADIGQTINYQTTITLEEGALNAVIHDKMTQGLTFNDNVAIDGLERDTDFSVSYPGIGEDTFTVTFTQAYLDTIKTSTPLVVTYSATLNEKAVVNLPASSEVGNGNDNETWLTWGEENRNETTHDWTRTYTWDIDIFKYARDGENATKALAGAKFTFATKDGATIMFTKVEENVYKRDESGDVSEITTDGTGKFQLIGLDEGKYTLEETVAPDGYNKLDNPIEVEIESDGIKVDQEKVQTVANRATYTPSGNESDALAVDVENKAGSTLPSTGGMGTTIFYVIGGILVLAAAIILISKRRVQQ